MHPNLDLRPFEPNMMPPQPRRLNLTPAQSAALVAFLRTLTDEEVLEESMFSDPFVHEKLLVLLLSGDRIPSYDLALSSP